VALTGLQQRVAALTAALPESAGFVLAGGAAMAAHDVLDRTTRDLDYFGGPDQAAAVHGLADAFEQAAKAEGLQTHRDRQWEAFVRFRVGDDRDETEVDFGIDYRALDPVQTRYGPALELRELGANKCWRSSHAPSHATSSISPYSPSGSRCLSSLRSPSTRIPVWTSTSLTSS
jgi:hypothetical protein